MITHAIDIPPGFSDGTFDAYLGALSTSGVRVLDRGPLKTVPESRHWHLTTGRGSGTIELTFDCQKHRVIVAVHDNRRGHWAVEGAEAVAADLRKLVATHF